MAYKQPPFTEAELVSGITQNNGAVFSYLYDCYAGNLFNYIKRIVSEESAAEEVLQNVFLKIYTHVSSYDPLKGRLFTWMLNIAKNECLDTLRSKAYRNNLQTFCIDLFLREEAANPYKRIDVMEVRKIVFGLPLDLRILIELSFFYGFSHHEIALLLQKPVGTVKTKIRKAYKCLRVLIEDQNSKGSNS